MARLPDRWNQPRSYAARRMSSCCDRVYGSSRPRVALPSVRILERLGTLLRPVIVPAVFSLALLYPVLLFAVQRISLVGVIEESVGYRYLHSLRLLYGDHERPWLPQGQLAGLGHMAIQLGLTAAGYSPLQMFPRVDAFTYLAAALPHVLAAIAFAWAVSSVRSFVGECLLALTFIVIAFDPGSGGQAGWFLTWPDYYTWAEAAAMIAVGWLLRLRSEQLHLGWANLARLGLFTGLCAAMKVTAVVFAVPIGLWLVLRTPANQFRKTGVFVVGWLLSAICTWIGIIFFYYQADPVATARHVTRLFGYMPNAARTLPFGQWLGEAVVHFPPDATSLSLLMVVMTGVTAALLPGRVFSLALLGACLVSAFVSHSRYQPQDLFETNMLLTVTGPVWVARVLLPWVESRATLGRAPVNVARFKTAGQLAILVCLGYMAISRLVVFPGLYLDVTKQTNRGDAQLSDFLAHTTGVTAFLIPDDAHSFDSVDSAIHKGGMDPPGLTWGDSPLVRDMFPQRHYFVENVGRYPNRPLDLLPYSTIVFVSVPGRGGQAEAADRLSDVFGVNLSQFDCGFRAELPYKEYIGCRKR